VLRFQEGAVRDFAALRRCPRAEPRTQRPGREVLVRLLRRHDFHRPLDAHLPFERLPREDERHRWVRGHLATLPAIEVREERETPFVEQLEQNEPDGR